MDDLKKLIEGSTGQFQKAIEKASQSNREQLKSALEASVRLPKEFKQPTAFQMPMPEMETQQEINEYQSASVFMKALADSALEWKQSLPEGYVPAILAVLYGGIQINVHNLAQVSFHGIRIQGDFNGSPCTMLAHQSTVQMLCYAQESSPDKPKNPIGFLWQGHKVEV
tara:strand:+ start:1961 stop:2464 length:504 start_codon:yes stop_codon:yes gene_type:complete